DAARNEAERANVDVGRAAPDVRPGVEDDASDGDPSRGRGIEQRDGHPSVFDLQTLDGEGERRWTLLGVLPAAAPRKPPAVGGADRPAAAPPTSVTRASRTSRWSS